MNQSLQPCTLATAIYSLILATCVFVQPSGRAEDWPQWNGPSRNGTISEKLPNSVPVSGFPKLWSVPVSYGYSGPAVAAGRLFITDYEKLTGEIENNPGGRSNLTGNERIFCLDEKTGKVLWQKQYSRPYSLSYAAGPRVTPTVDADRVYTLGAEGDLVCYFVSNGEIVWQRQLRDEYAKTTPIWGYSAAPLIQGNQLITLAGGDGSIVVSLDKLTGKEIWRALTASEIGYCPPTLIQAAGRDQLLIWDPENLNALDPKDGKLLWSTPLKPAYAMSIMTPIKSGNRLFVSGIGEVGEMFELGQSKPEIKRLWKGNPKNAVYCANSTPMFDGDYIYGSDCGKGSFICVRASDGERMWESFEPTTRGERRTSHGTAFIHKSGDNYYLFSEIGDLILARLSPEKYTELGRVHLIDPTNECFGRKVVWSYPAFANGCVFVRNDKEVVAYKLDGESPVAR
jgi:outer membrane protein assembly factor BamB